MPPSDITGKIKTMAKKPVVTWATVVAMVLGQAGGVAWGIKKVESAESKADTAMTIAVAVQKSFDVVQKNTDLILQVMLSQGKVVVDTVVIRDTTFVDSTKADTSKTRPR